MTTVADRHLLFGLLALQNGLIDQGQLLAAFQAWTLDKSRSLAGHLEARGDLTGARRVLLEALAAVHLEAHGGNVEQSLAAVSPGKSTRESLARLGDPDLEATLGHVASGHDSTNDGDVDRTASYAVGAATSEGQRFRVLRPHARGGLGAVFVALDSELHREVALKQILDHHADDPTSRQRFMIEAEITGGLEHPGIVPVYGLGTYADGRPYYAMRFIKGDSLKEAIEAFHADVLLKKDPGRRPLELRKLLRRFLDVCNAMEYAHSRGVLHRDIKPGNIIVGKHGETLVVDWGLAKPLGRVETGDDTGERALSPSSASGSAETLPGSALGTPSYMSPEQAGGNLDRLGPRSDVYSLGATLYCVLIGRPPFEGDDIGELLRRVERGDFVRPRQHDPSIDPALEAVCSKAMATRPEERYASCRALAEDVERWMADEPVSAFRDPLATRLTRWGRRHRTFAASVAALMASAVVGLSIGAFLINGERARAEANFRQARAAVDEYFTTVSESRLLKVPGLQPLRKELLDSAMKYYREFLSQRGHDSTVRVETASATFRVGWINLTLARNDEAVEPLRTATALYEALARSDPGVAEYRRLSAVGHGALGLLYGDQGRFEEAIQEHRKALEIREALAKENPGDLLIRGDVARSHRNIGNQYRALGKMKETLAEWEIALALGSGLLRGPLPRGSGRVDLTGRSDPSAILREDQGSLQLDRASVLREIGHLAEAQDAWREARDLFEGLWRESPADQALVGRLAACHSEGSVLLLDLGRFEEAYESLRRTLELQEKLAATNPAIVAHRLAATDTRLKLAWLQRQLGRPAEAMASLRTATSMAESLLTEMQGSAGSRNLLAQCLSQTVNALIQEGRPAEAASIARRAVAIVEELLRDEPNSVSFKASLSNAFRSVGRVEAATGRPAEAFRAFQRAAELDGSQGRRTMNC
jgi:serine/threonine-protein kinase